MAWRSSFMACSRSACTWSGLRSASCTTSKVAQSRMCAAPSSCTLRPSGSPMCRPTSHSLRRSPRQRPSAAMRWTRDLTRWLCNEAPLQAQEGTVVAHLFGMWLPRCQMDGQVVLSTCRHLSSRTGPSSVGGFFEFGTCNPPCVSHCL